MIDDLEASMGMHASDLHIDNYQGVHVENVHRYPGLTIFEMDFYQDTWCAPFPNEELVRMVEICSNHGVVDMPVPLWSKPFSRYIVEPDRYLTNLMPHYWP